MNKFVSAVRQTFLLEVPSYGNTIFYSFGFLALTCLAVLTVTGVVMVFMGSAWWLGAHWGIFFRSIHLWAAQAFVLIIIIHALAVFLTSGFKPPRRLTWMLGAVVAFLALAEAEFGYDLRGDFSSQYRALQAADFFNGAYLGKFVNTLDQAQAFGLHIIVIPLVMFALLFGHYLLVKTFGIAKPYRPEARYKMVAADHRKLFLRGGVLVALIVALAAVFPSPLIMPTTIADVAQDNSPLMAQTLTAEFTRTSDTATYFNSIEPYTYDVRRAYVEVPYAEYASSTGTANALDAWRAAPPAAQTAMETQASAFFQSASSTADLAAVVRNANPVISAVGSLVLMAKSGLYEAAVNNENPTINPTYSLRFLADTGVLDKEATALGITTDQWGMVREEGKTIPPGAWWLTPLGVLDHTVLANDPNGDRDGAEILGILALLIVFFPYLPYANRIPEKLHIAEWIWKRGQ